MCSIRIFAKACYEPTIVVHDTDSQIAIAMLLCKVDYNHKVVWLPTSKDIPSPFKGFVKTFEVYLVHAVTVTT